MGPMAIAEPLAPQTVQETHVPKGLLEGLALKLLVLEGDSASSIWPSVFA